MLTRKSFDEVFPLLHPGDIIAFGGNSLFSKWTKLTTRSVVTHTAVVIDIDHSATFNQSGACRLMEATSYRGKRTVMENCAFERISGYEGDIWWLPLSKQFRLSVKANRAQFIQFLKKQRHKKYDIWQLFGSVVDRTDATPLLKKLTWNKEDLSELFCSELVAKGLEYAGVLKDINASEVTPIDICRFNIYQKGYVQIKGQDTHIEGFSSLLPDNWGQEGWRYPKPCAQQSVAPDRVSVDANAVLPVSATPTNTSDPLR